MRYEDVVELGMFSPCTTAMTYKAHQMVVETRLRPRGDQNKKKRFWCYVNISVGKYALGAQELEGC